MLGGSLLLTVVIGLPLGVLLFLTGKGQLHAMPKLYGALSLVVNVLRSIPFIILMIVLMPLTYVLVGTKLGIRGAIPPLVIGAAPFFARLVETALREVERGVIEASQAMGATTWQIVRHVLAARSARKRMGWRDSHRYRAGRLHRDGRCDRRRRPGRSGLSLRLSELQVRLHGRHGAAADRAGAAAANAR